MTPVDIRRGDTPLVLAMPHTGTWLPDAVADALNERGRSLADTDWHIDRLYDGLLDDVTTVRATFHRYVIDANRDPGGASLYPGQNTTGLCPLTDFDGEPIWRAGRAPDETEIARRRAAFHAPYHAALAEEVERVRARHGVAILYDCHSIRSRIPFLFEGTLPDFNIGTNEGRSCAGEIERTVADICANAEHYTWILNGRFKGGWTTRHHGRPGRGVHAIQMELAQSAYLAAEAPPWDYESERAERLRHHLKGVLQAIVKTAISIESASRDRGN